MNRLTDAAARIAVVQDLFMSVPDLIRNLEPVSAISVLDNTHQEFVSIAYESAAVEFACKDIKEGYRLERWSTLFEMKSNLHPYHISIGLGWAFAKSDVLPDDFKDDIPVGILDMVYDGMGYYFALFKGRDTLKSKLIPDWAVNEIRNWFDQGVGRRLWYHCKGTPELLPEIMQSFPSNRQPDLWRGVGVACGYVGGSDQQQLETLTRISDEYSDEFMIGISMAEKCRRTTDRRTTDYGYVEVPTSDIRITDAS